MTQTRSYIEEDTSFRYQIIKKKKISKKSRDFLKLSILCVSCVKITAKLSRPNGNTVSPHSKIGNRLSMFILFVCTPIPVVLRATHPEHSWKDRPHYLIKLKLPCREQCVYCYLFHWHMSINLRLTTIGIGFLWLTLHIGQAVGLSIDQKESSVRALIIQGPRYTITDVLSTQLQ